MPGQGWTAERSAAETAGQGHARSHWGCLNPRGHATGVCHTRGGAAQDPPARLLQATTGRPRLMQALGTYRGFGFCSLGLFEPRFAGVQVQAAVLEEPSLLLRARHSEAWRPRGPSAAWERPGQPLTEMVFQSPSRKLRRGVRKLMEAVWMKSRSAAPRRFSASATLISVFPENRPGAGVRESTGR